MKKFSEKINIDGFSIDNIDISELDDLSLWLPINGVFDLNIAEQGVIKTLHAQNICQDQLVKLDRLISIKESEKNKAYSEAALTKAAAAGHKVVKSREWFAMGDDDYINASNEVALAKAAKKWLENKAAYFLAWHYAFKSFLKRDYSLEQLGNFQVNQGSIQGSGDGTWGSEETVWEESE